MSEPTAPIPEPTDPFLWAHTLRGQIYDIATSLRPSSVRDQINRARLLIRRALEFGILRSEARLVISGAGIAGVVAALEAVRYRVRVLLVEKDDAPFPLQRYCITRTVDPNLYDWPAHYWHNEMYPFEEGDAVPLSFETQERPRDIVRRWTDDLHDIAKRYPKYLELRYKTSIADVSPDLVSREHAVKLSNGTKLKASMVVYAQGVGVERDSVTPFTFHGFRFWDTDPFAKEPLAASRILIAGSGDGALQDFRRVLLLPKAEVRRILYALPLSAAALGVIQMHRFHNATAFLWCADFRHEHENELYVHQRHAEIVHDLFRKKVRRKTLQALAPFIRPTVPHVVLAHACEHFTHGYPVNRFIALLLAHAVPMLREAQVELRQNTFVTRIECHHKIGPLKERRLPRYCYAQPHTVAFRQPGACYDTPPPPQASDRTEDFDAIILRFGVKEQLPMNWKRDVDKPLRQLLPAHLAHLPHPLQRRQTTASK